MRSSSSKLCFGMLLLPFIFVTATAGPVTWTFSGLTLSDGGTVSGSFVYDADTSTYSSINVTTTNGSVRSGASYIGACFGTGVTCSATTLQLFTVGSGVLTGTPNFYITFLTALTNSGGTRNVSGGQESNCPNAGCTSPQAPSRSVVAGGTVTAPSATTTTTTIITTTTTTSTTTTTTTTTTTSTTTTSTTTSTTSTTTTSSTTTTIAPATLAVAKIGPARPVSAGETITYTIQVTNTGAVNATALTVTDNLPAGVGYQSASGAGWSCGQAAGVVTCTRPSLPPGPAPDIQITVTAPATPGTVVNTVSLSASNAAAAASASATTQVAVLVPVLNPFGLLVLALVLSATAVWFLRPAA